MTASAKNGSMNSNMQGFGLNPEPGTVKSETKEPNSA